MMNKNVARIRWFLGATALCAALLPGVYGISIASGEREHDGDEYREDEYESRLSGRAPQYDLYSEECGACHLAYPPALLPAASWQTIMDNLDDHFGDNAELDNATRNDIAGYLARHGARSDGNRLERRVLRGANGDSPIRITLLPYFIHEHDEIPTRMVTGNEEVGSFSRCDACHAQAAQGRFDEDTVVIPGYGRWDD